VIASLIDSTVYIHESAIVEDGASVGARTRVWHHAHVRRGASVGDDTNLGKNVYVDSGAKIGSRCKIQNNVSVYRGVTLEDGVFVGPSAVFTNDRFPRADKIDWNLVTTRVRSGASIGANATIVCGIVIDQYALIAAGSVVTRDVAAHELVGGNPIRRLGWVCICGEVIQRGTEAFQGGTCRTCGRTILVRSEGSAS
jgi:acetyltransferase-like isoleucine patch superfamily enzyme